MTPVPERTPNAQVAPNGRPLFAVGQRVQIASVVPNTFGASPAYVGGYGHVVAHLANVEPARWPSDRVLDHLVELHPSSPGIELVPDQHPGLWFAGSELAAID